MIVSTEGFFYFFYLISFVFFKGVKRAKSSPKKQKNMLGTLDITRPIDYMVAISGTQF